MKNIKKFTSPWRGKQNNGFTLVETLVGLLIFTLAVVALMTTLASSISNTNYAKQKFIAGYLAQEGIEYVRNMRDTFVIYDPGGAQPGWVAFQSQMASCTSRNGCYINGDDIQYGDPNQPITQIPVALCNRSCPNLFYDPTTGEYGYNSSGSDSGFSRSIRVTPVTNDEMQVQSIVTWTQGSGSYTMTFSENLFNWIE